MLLHKLDAVEIEEHISIRDQIQPDPDQMDIDEKPYIKKDFSCFQITKIPGVSDSRKMNFESGGKIIMPEIPEFLISFIQDDFSVEPLMFKLTHGDRSTHCGVLEFTAETDNIIMPIWMMHNLSVEEGNIVLVESIELPRAISVRLKTSSEEFLQRYNPKPMLEARLVHFTCLTEGDTVGVHVKGGVHHMKVIKTVPESAVCIVNCDLNVEFEPLAAQYPSRLGQLGIGRRLDGGLLDEDMEVDEALEDRCRDMGPDFIFSPGNLTFKREIEEERVIQNKEIYDEDWSPFCGRGRTLI